MLTVGALAGLTFALAPGTPPSPSAVKSYAIAQNIELWLQFIQVLTPRTPNFVTGCAQQSKRKWVCLTYPSSAAGKINSKDRPGIAHVSLVDHGRRIRFRSKSKIGFDIPGPPQDVRSLLQFDGAPPQGRRKGHLTYYYASPNSP
jgi:hypothetical protein